MKVKIFDERTLNFNEGKNLEALINKFLSSSAVHVHFVTQSFCMNDRGSAYLCTTVWYTEK